MSDRKTATRLSLENKWKIAQYCIENRVVVNTVGEILFRVQASVAAREINAANIVENTINSYHVIDSMDFYKRVCDMTKQMPFQTPQDSVREDQLVAQVKVQEEKIATLNNVVTVTSGKLNEALDKLHEISKIIPAECFGIKKR